MAGSSTGYEIELGWYSMVVQRSVLLFKSLYGTVSYAHRWCPCVEISGQTAEHACFRFRTSFPYIRFCGHPSEAGSSRHHASSWAVSAAAATSHGFPHLLPSQKCPYCDLFLTCWQLVFFRFYILIYYENFRTQSSILQYIYIGHHY